VHLGDRTVPLWRTDIPSHHAFTVESLLHAQTVFCDLWGRE